MQHRIKTKSYDIPFILEAQKIIDECPERRLTITALALEVGINAFKLKLGFKEITKKTIHQYRLKVRLQLAKNLLEETDFTIEEIAYKVGFDSRDGLANAFKKEFNLSPRQWRNEQFVLG